MDLSPITAPPVVPYAIQKSLLGQSNINYSYDAGRVKVIFEAVGITDIKSKEATAAVLSYLFPSTYPKDFFQGEKVELSLHTRDVKDSSREGIVVEYGNSFGWGDNEGWSGDPLFRQPYFTNLDVTASIKAQDTLYLPRVEDFTGERLNNIIFGARAAEVHAAHPLLLPFYHYHLAEDKQDLYASIQMAPRDHTFARVLNGETLFRDVIGTLKGSQTEFEKYVQLVKSESKVAQAQQKIAGVHDAYVQAFEGTGINVGTIAEYSLGCSEPAAIKSLEQLKLELGAEKANVLHAVSRRFIETGLRDHLVEYFTQSGPVMAAIKKRSFDLGFGD